VLHERALPLTHSHTHSHSHTESHTHVSERYCTVVMQAQCTCTLQTHASSNDVQPRVVSFHRIVRCDGHVRPRRWHLRDIGKANKPATRSCLGVRPHIMQKFEVPSRALNSTSHCRTCVLCTASMGTMRVECAHLNLDPL
jgi:hypothetical protein